MHNENEYLLTNRSLAGVMEYATICQPWVVETEREREGGKHKNINITWISTGPWRLNSEPGQTQEKKQCESNSNENGLESSSLVMLKKVCQQRCMTDVGGGRTSLCSGRSLA